MPKQQHHHEPKRFQPKYAAPSAQPNTRRRRYIIISVISVIVLAILGVTGWSIYNNIKPYDQPAIRVNGVTLNMRYYINMLKLYYGNAPPDTGISDFADYYEQQIEHSQIILQGSQALGVPIKRSDVAAEVAKTGKPVTRESVDLMMTQDLINKQVPTSQTQYHVIDMLLESQAAAESAQARVQAGESFVAVAAELSRLPASTNNLTELSWVTPRQADLMMGSSQFGDAFSKAGVGALTGPVYDATVSKQYGYWVAKAIDKRAATDNTSSDALHIQGILVGSEQDAQDVISKLNGGADINELAKQVSQEYGAQDNGAELGWVTKNDVTSPFASLFDQPLNTVVGPIGFDQSQTKGGYWLFNVLEKKDDMALTSEQQNTLDNDLLDRCTAALSKNPKYKVENLLTQKMKDFALDRVVAAQGKGSVIISDAQLPYGEQGLPYSYKIQVYGDSQGSTWSISDGTLPQGLSLDPATGVISGVPTFAGSAEITVKVGNSYHYWTQTLVITNFIAISIRTTSLPDGQAGMAYYQVLDSMTDAPSLTWKIISGSLPDGLTLNSTGGGIVGTPKTAGTYNFTVQVDDGVNKATQPLSLNITPAADSNNQTTDNSTQTTSTP